MGSRKANAVLILGSALQVLALGLVLGGFSPAVAQNRPEQLGPASTRGLASLNPHPLLPQVPTTPKAFSPAQGRRPWLVAPSPFVIEQPAASTGPAFWASFRTSSLSEPPPDFPTLTGDTTPLNPGHNHNSLVESQVDYVLTPFSEQVRLPFFRLWGGRLEMGAFDFDRSTENVLLGPPGAGSLPVWSVSAQAHSAGLTPRDDVSYGMMLSLRFKGNTEPGPHIHSWRCLGWIVGAGRGCRLD